MKTTIVITLLIASVAFLYRNTLDNPLIFDDSHALEEMHEYAQRYPTVPQFLKALITQADRHITYLSFESITHLTNDLRWQRVLNIGLHAANSVLIFLFLSMLFGNRKVGAVMAFFFAVNPAAIHAVCYLVQRSILLAVFFGLIQCILFLKSLRIKSKIGATILFAGSVLMFLFAKFSKEQAITFAAMYPLLGFAFFSQRALLFNLAIAIPVLFHWERVASLFLTPYVDNFANTRIVMESCGLSPDGIMGKSVGTQMRLFPKYFLTWLLPLKTSIDMREPIVGGFGQAIPFLLWSGAGFLTLYSRQLSILGVGLLASICFFLPELTVSRIGEVFVVYRSYLYAVGFMIIIGHFVSRFKGFKMAALAGIGLLAFISPDRAMVFDDEVALWTNAVKSYNRKAWCQAARTYDSLGVAHLKAMSGDNTVLNIMKSIDAFQRSIEIHPYSSLANLGASYHFLGADTEAEKALQKAVEGDKNEDRVLSALFNLGALKMKRGEFKEARKYFTRTLEIRPSYKSGAQGIEMLNDVIKEAHKPSSRFLHKEKAGSKAKHLS